MKHSVRIDEAATTGILDRLDQRESSRGATNRRCDRYSYRVRAVVEFFRDDGAFRETVPCRNLSRDGICFLTHRFVYAGTRVRVRLVSDFSHAYVIEGRVARIRYVEGTPGIHECGVAFNAPIDIAMFHRDASSVKLLVIDPHPDQRPMLGKLLKKHGAEATFVESPVEAGELVAQTVFDLLLVNSDRADVSTCEFVRTLRGGGYLRPITSFTMQSLDEFTRARCQPEACEACTIAQLSLSDLAALVEELKTEPVVSVHAASDEVGEIINEFVAIAHSTVPVLEAHFLSEDRAPFRAAVSRFAVLAKSAGFDEISELAQQLSLTAPANPAEERKMFNRLVRMCLAARPTAAK